MRLTNLEKAIYKTYEINSKPRDYMGASMLGNPCNRALWLSFRWVMPKEFDGRMLKLFNVGHREEELAANELVETGVDIRNIGRDQLHLPLAPHVIGHPDGVIYGGIKEITEYPILWEMKTSNTEGFEQMIRVGVQIAKPLHYAQMQVQMYYTGYTACLYEVVCKENSKLYTEVVPINPDYAQYMLNRAYAVALMENMPDGISKDKASKDCQYCDYATLCFLEASTTTITCRNCHHSKPMEDGTWICKSFNFSLTTEQQREGCGWHIVHPDTVPYTLIKQDQYSRTYLVNDTELINGVKDNLLHFSTENFIKEAINVSIKGLSTDGDNQPF